jgi:hypothetical protein
MSVGVAALSVVITFVGSLLYRLRWHMRLWLFHIGTWLQPRRPTSTSTRRFDFDLFVSHNANDTPWVYDVLLPELETRSNPAFRVCVYNRNWMIGRRIDECFVESVERSRKTLMLITNAFAKSEWCMYELFMAQHQLIDADSDSIVLAIMEDIEPLNLSPRLRLQLQRRVHLQWTEDVTAQRLFWNRLKMMLRAPVQSLIHATPSEEETRALLA